MKGRLVPYVSIVVGVTLWSTIEVVSILTDGVTELSAAEITFLRFFVGGLVVLPFGIYHARRSGFRPKMGFAAACVLLGLLSVVLCMWLFHLSLKYMRVASSAAALFCGHPLVVALIAVPLLKEDLSRRVFAGVVVGVVGVVVVSLGQWEADARTLTGIVLIIVAGALFALYTVLLKMFHRKGATILAFCLSSIAGSLMLLSWVLGRADASDLMARVKPGVLHILFLGVVSTGLGYLCYFWGICHVPASSGTSFIYLKPVIATLLGVILLDEQVLPSLVVGVVLIMIGLALVVRRQKAGARRGQEGMLCGGDA